MTSDPSISMPDVARHSLLTMCAGLASGAMYSAYTGKRMGPAAIQMGSMWGSTGVLYWYTRANIFNYLTETDPLQQQQQLHEITTRRKLVSSMGAGLVTGVLSTSIVYGPRIKIVAPSGLVTMILAGSFQWLYSYAQTSRVDLLVWYYNKRGYSLPNTDKQQQQVPTQPLWTLIPYLPQVQKHVQNTLTTNKWLPVRMLTNDEYASRLDQQVQALNTDLNTYEKVMRKLKEQINALEKPT